MMLPEMTDSAGARAFRRFARGALVGLALAGLAACGGGGGKATTTPEATPAPAPTRTPAPAPAPGTTPRPPEMTITPPAAEEPDTIEDAVAITVGKAVSGTLSSPTDVDFFRLPLAEPGTATFWTTGEADTVVTLLDEEGNDLSASAAGGGGASTLALAAYSLAPSSEDRVRVTTALDDVYARVKGREEGRTGNYNLHNEFEEDLPPRILMAFSNVAVQAGGSPVRVDLSRFFVDPEGGNLTFGTRLPEVQVGPVSLGLSISGSILEITSPANMRAGPVSITVTASDPLGLVTVQVLSVTVQPGGNAATDPNDCMAVSVRRISEDHCRAVNDGRGGGLYVARFTNSCTEGIDIRYEWSKYSDRLPRRSIGGLFASAGGTTKTSTGCISGTQPSIRACASLESSDTNRCYRSGSDAHHETYSFEEEG